MHDTSVSYRDWLIAVLISAILVVIVWWPLVNGGGLVGGDLYPYFFPQKQVVAECFAGGSIPMWHHRTGLGYPLHAESQAGIYYPTTQVLYRITDVHSAYHINLLLHYWLAFIFAWRVLRCYKIGTLAALFGSLVFVYGWFPARVSLEWSIIGGVFLPLTVWQTEEFVLRPSIRRLIGLASCFAVHLLAGHFALAFICQLTCLVYAFGRSWQLRKPDASPSGSKDLKRTANAFHKLPDPVRNVVAVSLAIGCSLFLAAIQLLPTLELKRLSQREPMSNTTAESPDEFAGEAASAFDPAYGHMPPGYLTQIFYSWFGWHAADSIQGGDIFRAAGSVAADTNKVEAHLYWGLIPLALILAFAFPKFRRQLSSDAWKLWLILMLLATVYATGWLMPVTKHLPGFGFFMGPGRYLIVTALGGSVLCASVMDFVIKGHSKMVATLVVATVSGITLWDLQQSSSNVADAVVVQQPPLLAAKDSWIRKTISPKPGHFEARILAPGPNVINLFGASGIPVYLGIGPSVYYSDILRPKLSEPEHQESLRRSVLDLRITHVLSTEPLSGLTDILNPPTAYPDAMLSRIWGTSEAPYLYVVKQPVGRISSRPQNSLEDVRLLARTGESIEFQVTCREPCVVELCELMYPGWTVSVNGSVVQAESSDQIYRAVQVPAGQSTVSWTYSPTSFPIGKWVSILSFAFTLFAAVVQRKNGST